MNNPKSAVRLLLGLGQLWATALPPLTRWSEGCGSASVLLPAKAVCLPVPLAAEQEAASSPLQLGLRLAFVPWWNGFWVVPAPTSQ